MLDILIKAFVIVAGIIIALTVLFSGMIFRRKKPRYKTLKEKAAEQRERDQQLARKARLRTQFRSDMTKVKPVSFAEPQTELLEIDQSDLSEQQESSQSEVVVPRSFQQWKKIRDAALEGIEKEAPPYLWNKLVGLTKDEKTAVRLLKTVCMNHPSQSVDWCCEKAIRDLHRDRR